MSVTSNLDLPFGPDGPAESADNDRDARLAAVDPMRNIALSASAGTGKTRVLVDRYVNLLRAGVNPANILAITFTRKAAAEMRERIVRTIREAAARTEISPLRWRELKDRLGEIAISTIDAFCLSLLGEFPLEADLDPGFTMAEETEIPRLVEETLDRTLRTCRALARDDEDVALAYVQLGERRLREGLGALLDRRLVAGEAFSSFLERGPNDLTATEASRRVIERLRGQLLAVPGGLQSFLNDGPRRHPRFEMLAREIELICGIRPAGPAGTPANDAGRVRAVIEAIRNHFFTQDNTPRKALTPYSVGDCTSSAAAKRHREIVAFMAPAIGEAIEAFRRDLNVVMSRGVWRMLQIAAKDYRRTLSLHGVLDFPELLIRAIDLLKQMDEFARSRYLLESRYHHVLVDEFQDTSRAQWRLVTLLIRAWSEGVGVADDAPLKPSIFIVGDMKQSIYGFRDADVAVFRHAAGYIDGLRPGTRSRRSISRNFRSVPQILSFINDLFGALDASQGRDDAFEFSPPDRFPLDEQPAAIDRPLGIVVSDELETCVEMVAVEIERLLREGTVRDPETGVSRSAQAGDIAILFRSRESHREFEAALAARGLAAYVYKGLGFFDADEIKDVLALLRWLAHPTSDLRAAAFLRSRFVRLSDPGIHVLGAEQAAALWSENATAAFPKLDEEDQRVLDRARRSARQWLALVDRLPPADLLDRVLDESAYAIEIGGPRRAQARENLKKMRGLVRRTQNRGYATLARIADHLDRLSAGDESNAVVDAVDAVNLMTIHASKGLEFPIVFLVNLAKGTSGRKPPIRVWPAPAPRVDLPPGDSNEGRPAEGASVAIGDFQSEIDDDAVVKAREETKRLLYVGLTRARDCLYLSSVLKEGRLQAARGSLADILPPSVRSLLEESARDRPHTIEWIAPGGARHEFRVCALDDTAPTAERRVPIAAPPSAGADDFAPVADGAPMARVSVLSLIEPTLSDDRRGDLAALEQGGEGDREALLAGTLVHRMFLVTAGIASDEDPRLTPELVESLIRADELPSVSDPDRLARSVLAIYRTLRAQPEVHGLLAGRACLYEVPFSLRKNWPSPTIVRGTIDCVVREADDRFTVLEFKTGKPRPEHERQLALYVEAAQALLPRGMVRGLLVYPG